MAVGDPHTDRATLGARTPLGQTFLSPKFLSPLGARSLTVLQLLPLPSAEPLGETVQRQPALGPGESLTASTPSSTTPSLQRQPNDSASTSNVQRRAIAPSPADATIQRQVRETASTPSDTPTVQRQASETASVPSETPNVQRQASETVSTPNVQRQARETVSTPNVQRQASETPSTSSDTPTIQRQPGTTSPADATTVQRQASEIASTSSEAPNVQRQASEPDSAQEPTVAQLLADSGSIPEVPRATGRSLSSTPIQRQEVSSTPSRWSTLAQLMGEPETPASAPSPQPDTVVQRFLAADEGSEPEDDEEDDTHPLQAAVLRALENAEGLDNRHEFLLRALASRFEDDDGEFNESFVNTWREYIEDEDDDFQTEFLRQSFEINVLSLLEAQLSQEESDERLLEQLAARLQNADDEFLTALAAVIHEADVIFPDDDLLEDEAGQNLEMLAHEMYTLLRQRLALERERQGTYYAGRLSW